MEPKARKMYMMALTLLATSSEDGFPPPAPRPVIAEYMPGKQKSMAPTTKFWLKGLLRRIFSLSVVVIVLDVQPLG